MSDDYTPESFIPEPIRRLSRDLVKAGRLITPDEARFLVDAYYIMQDDRKRANSQLEALERARKTDIEGRTVGEPNEILEWYAEQTTTLENIIKRVLDNFSAAQELGVWARSQVGIGPVISAGLLAHIDIKKAPTVGHIWRFAGLDPTSKWNKGEKRPWNAQLKVLCWKIGESFVKVSGRDNAFYGQIYLDRKKYEMDRNDRGGNAARAAEILTEKKFKKTTDAYGHLIGGKLPPAQIHGRAKRYAVKLFLAHYHDVGYRLEFGTAPPKPYAIAHLGHAHEIPPPDAVGLPPPA